ncbi:queuosine salvage protein-like [Nylanderia fulva]|uniref:queuosine salvage protein-like n=1 Tax=Nylanderia fulva TaxID=613905 RepID=UPI0010FB7583|nr:queuosine salvage protein-like [Nylanderia fulva]
MANKKKKSSALDVKESLEAVKFIEKYAQDVRIDLEKLKKFANLLIQFLTENNMNHTKRLLNTSIRSEHYPNFTEETVDWLFVFHTLNFSLFYPQGIKQWRAGDKDGFYALSFAIKRAIDNEKPLWDPKYYSKLTLNELEDIFRSDDGETTIPLLNERLTALHQIGNVLLEKYEGTFKNCIKSAEYNSDKLMKLLFDEFEPYRDEAKYRNKTVRLYTKANSLIKDIWACYKKKNMFHLNKENMMSTMFIDYRSPIVLFYCKVLTYGNKRLQKLKNNDQLLKHGDAEELELRACSLLAVNKILKQIEKEWRNKYPEYDRQNILHLIDNYLLLIIPHRFDKYVCDQPLRYIESVYY